MARAPDTGSELKRSLFDLADQWEQMAAQAEARTEIYLRLSALANGWFPRRNGKIRIARGAAGGATAQPQARSPESAR